jgi:hypothetical protein
MGMARRKVCRRSWAESAVVAGARRIEHGSSLSLSGQAFR